ncbi:MAG: CGGC domain-containing protein [Proteobacteria bacterium]|nr:CGGC domain-containing protein [Pseudomonadota bacterium]MBU1742040.1 CGGC domain-containing protein [Pseudomonadota bacterium]
MTKVGIVSCFNVTEEHGCVMIGCLAHARGKKTFFESHEGEVVLQGVITCHGCPTAVGSARILKRVKMLTDYGIDALHFSSCMVQLCPFLDEFETDVRAEFPELTIVRGTHPYLDEEAFKRGVSELNAQRVRPPQNINDVVFKRIEFPEKE